MSNQINVGFKVTGTELSQYIDAISRKSEKQAQDAIQSALAQNVACKEQVAIIEKTISEKKSRLENWAARAILTEQREAAMRANTQKYEGLKKVFSNGFLSETQKKRKDNCFVRQSNGRK